VKLTVLIPAYNEAPTIGQVLAAVDRVVLPDAALEVVVIDDGSTDGTAEEVQRYLNDHPGKPGLMLVRQANGGKGSAIRAGLRQATGDFVIVQDADLEYDPTEFGVLVEAARREGARVVYGSRNQAGGNPRSYFTFYWGGRLLSVAVNLLYGSRLSDYATCYKLIERRLLEELRLSCDGFEFCAEVTAKVLRRGIPIVEVPIRYRPRSIAEGKKIRYRDGLIAFWTFLRIRFQKKM